MTLGGLLKHMALVEDSWFTRWLHGRDIGAPWNAVDWGAEDDWEWNSAANDTPEQLRQLWHEAVERSRAAVEEALADAAVESLATGRVARPAM